MNTCKATLLVLRAHRLYVIIYLVLIGILMLSLSWGMLSASVRSVGDTYQPVKVQVAVVDRDADRGGIADAMREYLSDSATLVELKDDTESLQQAVASNWADLIVIIPDGYAQRFLDATRSGTDMPEVDTVTSYASGSGSIGSMNVSGFLSLTRLALVGGNVTLDTSDPATMAALGSLSGEAFSGADGAGGTGARKDWSASGLGDVLDKLPEGTLRDMSMDDLATAARKAADLTHDKEANRGVAVVATSGSGAEAGGTDAGSVDKVNPAITGFGNTMKTALYPMFLAMSICVCLIAGAFNSGEVRRRLAAAPRHGSAMGMQRMATMGGLSLLVSVAYAVISFVLVAARGLDVTTLPVPGVLMVLASGCVYALMSVACGFMLGEFGCGTTAANGFANIVGLLILFTSGVSLPANMMPDAMLALARVTPGWWYCVGIDNALGFGTAGSVDVGAWAGSVGLVALFGVAFVCVGLAGGRWRRSRPTAAPAVTELAEA